MPGKADEAETEVEETEEEAAVDGPLDLLVLRPFNSKKSSKSYSVGKSIWQLKNTLAGLFGKVYAQDNRIAAAMEQGPEEESEDLENALFIRIDRYEADDMERIVNFDEVQKFAEEKEAHLLLLTDIKEMRERTEEVTGLLDKKRIKQWLDVKIAAFLYDAREKRVLHKEIYSSSTLLGEKRLGLLEQTAYHQAGLTANLPSNFVVGSPTFFQGIDRFASSPMGVPFRTIYSDMMMDMGPKIYSALGLTGASDNGASNRDMLILSASRTNDDVRVFEYLADQKKFDELLPVARASDIFPGYDNGLNVAAGDVDGDGVDELSVAIQDPKSPRKFKSEPIRALSYRERHFDQENPLAVLPYLDEERHTGAFLAMGDFDGDGDDELAVSHRDSRSRVVICDYRNGAFDLDSPFRVIENAFPEDNQEKETYTDGVFLTAGDLDGNGDDELIVSKTSGGDHVKAFNFDGRKTDQIGEFQGLYDNYALGVFLAAGDFDGDGDDEVAISTMGGNDDVRVVDYRDGEFDTENLFGHIFDNYVGYDSGLAVSAGDFDGDGADELAVSTITANDDVRVFKYRDGEFQVNSPFGRIYDNYVDYNDGLIIGTGRF